MNTPDRPIVTVDVVLLTLLEGRLCCLLTQRDSEPFIGQWALPGGYVRVGEDDTAMDCAIRVLAKKAGVVSPYLEQLQTFADAGRDPRGWSVSIAHYALVPASVLPTAIGEQRRWVPVGDVGALPFDHNRILDAALARLRSKTLYSSLPVYLIPEFFTLGELQAVCELLLQGKLDKRGFRRHVERLGILEVVPGMSIQAGGRPAQVFRLRASHRGSLQLVDRNLGLLTGE